MSKTIAILTGGGDCPGLNAVIRVAIPAAYISTTKVIRTTGVGPVLITAMLESGFTYGAATLVMNAVHCTVTEDAPSFLLVGDAADRLRPEETGAYVMVDSLAESGRLELDLGDFFGHFVQVDVMGKLAENFADDPDITLDVISADPMLPEIGQPLNAVIVPHRLGSPLSILLFSFAPVRLARLTLMLRNVTKPRAEAAAELAALEKNIYQMTAIQNHVANVTGHRRTPERKKQAVDLLEALNQADWLLKQALATFYAAQSRVLELPRLGTDELMLGRFRLALETIDQFLAHSWPSWDMPQLLSPLYSEVLYSRGPEHPERLCYLCGIQTFDLFFESHARRDLKRILTHCPHCDVLFDRPAEEPFVEILGPGETVAGEKLHQRLLVHNDSPIEKKYNSAVSLDGSYPWFHGTFTPVSQHFTVPSKSVNELSFDIIVDRDTVPGVYHIVVFTVHHLSWNVSVKPIRVRL